MAAAFNREVHGICTSLPRRVSRLIVLHVKWNEPKGYAEYKWHDVGRKAFFRIMVVLVLVLGLLVCLQVWLWQSDDLAFLTYLIGTFLIIVPVTV